jgi:hypothetical protein
MEEIWKVVIENYCEVSNFGRVKTLGRWIEWNGTNKYLKEKFLSLKPHNTGYVRVRLAYEDFKADIAAHILVADAFIPNPEGKPQVNHKDSNRSNNHVDNLEWVTILENIEHAYSKDRMATGERCPISKLKEHEVIEIRAELSKGIPDKILANRYDVAVGTIGRIRTGDTWKHI